jgi:hypothetical protein|tara:strand:+ start:1160 stop:1264 length:105 start_codon:yes stop_codon:yes gene_type:complete
MVGDGIGVQLLLLILFGFFILWIIDEGSNKKDDE